MLVPRIHSHLFSFRSLFVPDHIYKPLVFLAPKNFRICIFISPRGNLPETQGPRPAIRDPRPVVLEHKGESYA